MSSERAGAPTHGALNRETARPVLVGLMVGAPATYRINAALDALEAYVVPDPRIAVDTSRAVLNRVREELLPHDYDVELNAIAAEFGVEPYNWEAVLDADA